MIQVLPVLTKNIRQLKSWIEIIVLYLPIKKMSMYHAAKADYDRRPTTPSSNATNPALVMLSGSSSRTSLAFSADDDLGRSLVRLTPEQQSRKGA